MHSGTAPRVLVVEDDAKTRECVAEALRLEGWDLACAASGVEALACLAGTTFDLVILDRMLPGCDGLTVIAGVRARTAPPRILMLTAQSSLEDRVSGLNAGAVDYLAKPFSLVELVARCRALFRRSPAPEPATMAYRDLRLDVRSRSAWRSGRAIPLSPREVDVLDFLLRHAERVVSREMLEREVWREPRRFTTLDNVIEVQMLRLRRKVDAPGEAKLIQTVRGRGYLLGRMAA